MEYIQTTPNTCFPKERRSLTDYEVYSETEHETEPRTYYLH